MGLKPGLISVNIYLAGLTNNAETGGLSSLLGLYKYFIMLSNYYLKLDEKVRERAFWVLWSVSPKVLTIDRNKP